MKSCLKLIVFSFLLAGCFHGRVNKRLFTFPNSIKLTDNELILAISSHRNGDTSEKENNFNNVKIKSGGKDALKKYLSILRNSFQNKSLFIDTGRLLSQNPTEEEISLIESLYKEIRPDVILQTVSDTYQKSILNNEKFSNLNFINSNIIDIKTQELSKINNSKLIKEFIIDGNKIVIIPISTLQATKNKETLKGLYLEDPVGSILKSISNIESNVTKILLIDSGTSCKSKNHYLEKKGHHYRDQGLSCPKDDSLKKIISRLPEKSIDLIISTGNNIANGFIGKIPVVQGPKENDFLSILKITIDKNTGRPIPKKTVIFPPIKLCHEFLKESEDCHQGNSAPEQKFRKTNAKFLGKSFTL